MRIEKLTASPPQLSYKKTCMARALFNEYDYTRLHQMIGQMQRERPGERFTESSVVRDIVNYFVTSFFENRSEESETSLAQVLH